jgi:hypothetical protein
MRNLTHSTLRVDTARRSSAIVPATRALVLFRSSACRHLVSIPAHYGNLLPIYLDYSATPLRDRNRYVANLMTQLEHLGRNDVSGRELFLLGVPSVSDIPEELNLESKYFGVLLAFDARGVDDALILDLARSLAASGMRFFCSWGSDCERVHDLFDSAVFEYDVDQTDESVIMTTWLDDPSLDEALWESLYVSFPASDYWEECRAQVAITIGNQAWAEQVKHRYSDLSALNKDVLGDGAI